MSAKILDWWFYLALLASLGTSLLFAFSENIGVREAAAAASISFLGAAGAIQVWKALLSVPDQRESGKHPIRIGAIWAAIGFLLAASAFLIGYGMGLAD